MKFEFDNIIKKSKITTNKDSKRINKEYFLIQNNDEFENKYRKYLDREDKYQLLLQIKSEISKKYKNISILELGMLSSNFYDFCCLMAYEVSEDKIIKYFLYKNSHYYENLTNEDMNKFIPTDNKKLEILASLVQKYIKIFKCETES